MATQSTFSNLANTMSPITSALKGSISKAAGTNPLAAPTGGISSPVIKNSFTPNAINVNNPPAPQSQASGLGGAVSGLLGQAGNMMGTAGNFLNNVWNGTSGGYNNFGASPIVQPQSGNVSTNQPSSNGGLTGLSSSPSPSNSTIPLAGGGVTTSQGGYAGNPSTNPNIQQSTAGGTNASNGIGYAANGAPTGGNQNSMITPGGGSATPGSTVADTSQNPFMTNVNTQTNYANGGGNPGVNTSQQGLQSIANNQTPQVTQAYNNLANFETQNPLIQSAQASLPMAALISSGRGQILGNQLSGEQQGLANAYGQAVQGEGQQITAGSNAGQIAQNQQNEQISAANNAAGLTQPQAGASYFGSPVTGGVVGQGAGLVSTAVNQATQLVQNGADPQTVLAQLTSAYGAGSPAVVAFQQSLLNKNSGYNPTAQSASAQQTASQGAQTGGEAYQLSTALKQVDTINPVIGSFLSTTGINPTTSPLYNQPINSYISNLGNPGAMAQYNTMMTDLQNFSSQIVASGNAQTPTAITAANALQNPSNLSLKDIQSYMNTLTTLGQNRLSVLQSQAGASGYTGYAGSPATPQTSTAPATSGTTPGSNVTNPLAQGIIGGGISALGSAEAGIGTAVGLATKLFSSL
jgi:hypothetical protein